MTNAAKPLSAAADSNIENAEAGREACSMNIVLLGQPGSGKGTQAMRLVSRFAMMHLSTGEMLRAAVESGRPIGTKVRAIMDAGKLVPDQIVSDLIEDRLAALPPETGLVFDGYPRTSAQAQSLDRILALYGRTLDLVIDLTVDAESLVERITGRYSCELCGEGYHERFKVPKVPGRCDECGNESFSRRVDDRTETALKRFREYSSNTAPIVSLYQQRGLLRSLDGMADIDSVAANLAQLLRKEAATKASAKT